MGKGIEPLGPITVDDAREAFAEQIKALADAGVDVLLLETFPSLAEIQLAVAVCGQVADLPVIAQLTFTEEGRTLAGDSPEEVVKALADYKLTAIGANCSVGPQPMLDVVEAIAPSCRYAPFCFTQCWLSYGGGRALVLFVVPGVRGRLCGTDP